MHSAASASASGTSDGTKVHDDLRLGAYRRFHRFSPPYALAPGDWLDYECSRQRRHPAAPPRRLGQPITIAFVRQCRDEMCILTGQYYQTDYSLT